MSNIKLSGSQVLDVYIETIEEGEEFIKKAEYMENVSFWMKGKAYKSIKEIIEEGHTPYRSFKHYFDDCTAVQSKGYNYAAKLIKAFEKVEAMREQGTPDEELPKTESACREIIKREQPPKPETTTKAPDLLDDTLYYMDELIDRLHLIEKLIIGGTRPDEIKAITLTTGLKTLLELTTNLLKYEK